MKSKAEKIVDRLLRDLAGRAGIGDEWDQMDTEVQVGFRQDWITLVETCLNS